MSLTIAEAKKWITSDGTEHTTRAMAVHWVHLNDLLDRLVRDDRDRNQAQDLINDIDNHRKEFRAYFDACDAMERAATR